MSCKEKTLPRVLDALGLEGSDLFTDTTRTTNGRNTIEEKLSIVARFDYRNEAGALVYQIERLQGTAHKKNGEKQKSFRARRPDQNGGWLYNLNGVSPLPYRLPEFLAADPSSPVFIPEGEAKVDALRALGLVATCNHGGVKRWTMALAAHLKGRHVIVMPDNNAVDRDHAEAVAQSLRGVSASIKVLALPGLPEGGDVVDWLAAGRTPKDLERFAETALIWNPPSPADLDELDRELDVALESARDTTQWSFKRIGADFRFVFPTGREFGPVETIASALGANADVIKRLWYRRMAAPIADDIEAVREIVDRRGVRFIVVDSWRYATGVVGGGDPADATIRAMEALRELNRTVLIVGHSPRPQGDDKDHPSLYGSVFGTNIVRSLVFVKAIGDAGSPKSRLVLHHEKTNEISAPPVGLTFYYSTDADWGSRIVGVKEYDITTDPDARTGAYQKMKSALKRDRRKMFTSELAEAVGT